MAQAVNFSVRAFANGTIFICSKVFDLAGTRITSADLSGISYTIYSLGTRGNSERRAVTGHENVSLSVADVFFDTLQTGVFNGSNVEYNFRWTIDNSENECFPNANEKYLVRIDFHPVSGFVSPIQIIVDAI
ncbi:MAG: hypothetical protein Q4C70_03485 [Planctomycetia bacterium]|nr:hypothetical protein [Planctomycetia bacterium]